MHFYNELTHFFLRFITYVLNFFCFQFFQAFLVPDNRSLLLSWHSTEIWNVQHIINKYKTTTMANPILNSCCRCQTLKTGSIIAGVGAILLSIVAIIIMFTVRVTYRTILFDWLPPWIVKIVIGFNLCMTILISIIMIIGAMKVSNWFSHSFRCWVFFFIHALWTVFIPNNEQCHLQTNKQNFYLHKKPKFLSSVIII